LRNMKKNTGHIMTASVLIAVFSLATVLVLPSLLPNAAGAGVAKPCPGCQVVILSPGNGGALNNQQDVGTSFLVSFFVKNFTLVQPGTSQDVNTTTSTSPIHNEGHIHVFVDGNYITIWARPEGIPLTVTPGSHTIKLELVNDSHQSFPTPITASTTINAVDPNGTTQTYTMGGLIVSVIVLVLVALGLLMWMRRKPSMK
jgi:hypothetical protein